MMATAAESDDLWNVVIIAGPRSSLYRLPGSATVGSVKERWLEEHRPRGGAVVKSAASLRLPDSMLLSEVGEVTPDARTVNLKLEETQLLFLKSLSDGELLPIAEELSSLPDQLHAEVRQRLGVSERRFFRLCDRRGPLRYDQSLEQQGVEAEAVLEVDLGFQVTVAAAWEDLVTRAILFGSETAEEALPDDYADDERFLVDGRRLDVTRRLGDALPAEVKALTELVIHRRRPRSITLQVERLMRPRTAWPNQPLHCLLQGVPPVPAALMVDGRLLSHSQPCRDAQLQQHTVVHSSFAVNVRLSNGDCQRVCVGKQATVSDLHDAVSAKEGNSHFDISSGGRVLSRHERVDKAVVDASVRVERWMMTVTLKDRGVRWTSGTLHFSQLVNRVARRSAVELRRLVEAHLRCDGCGRRVKEVPVACCEVRSLWMTDCTPEPCREVGTQAEVWLNREDDEGKRQTVDAAVQTDNIQSREKRPFPFYIYNKFPRFTTNSNHLVKKLLLPDDATVGDVRQAIADVLKSSPGDIVLMRTVSSRLGQPVYYVMKDVTDWADEDGNIFDINDKSVARKKRLTLENDAEHFPLPKLPAGYEHEIWISKR